MRSGALLRLGQMRVRILVVAALLSGLSLGGCTSAVRSDTPGSTPAQSRQAGYVPEQHYTTSSTHEAWTLGGQPVEITLTRPSGNARFPLVIYLPGLGESSSAGAAWRQAWAQAGYAVLSLQSPSNGESLWSSPQARRGDFSDIAREHFARESLAARLEMLRNLLDEINRRGNTAAFAMVDNSRIALAGFDIGAQTVMAAAGETGYDPVPFALPRAVKCVIALSPYADPAGAPFEQRFATIHVPVLSITSLDDMDPYGLLTAAKLRRIPFEYMPPGQKYLLSLADAPHALIAGKETPSPEGSALAQNDSARSTSSDGAASPTSSGHHRGDSGGAQRGRRSSNGADAAKSFTVSAEAWKAQLAKVQGVTTAYLDATLRNDGVASERLGRDAQRWLSAEAELIVK